MEVAKRRTDVDKGMAEERAAALAKAAFERKDLRDYLFDMEDVAGHLVAVGDLLDAAAKASDSEEFNSIDWPEVAALLRNLGRRVQESTDMLFMLIREEPQPTQEARRRAEEGHHEEG